MMRFLIALVLACTTVIGFYLYEAEHEETARIDERLSFAVEELAIATERASAAISLSQRLREQDEDLKRRLATALNEIPVCSHTAMVRK